jgi:hyaluronan synthase
MSPTTDQSNAAPHLAFAPAARGLRIPTAVERILAVVLFLAAAAAALHFSHGVYWYGAIALGMVGVKLGAAVFYRSAPRPPLPVATIAAVVPFFNEDPTALLRCLESLQSQTRPPDEIWVIDDGSTNPWAYHVASAALDSVPNTVVVRYDHNRGKRHAQAYAFRKTQCDLVLTVDSDTVLESNAVDELTRVFSDPDVQAATGSVRALNPDTNLLTRLTDLRYANAFLYERAAYSRVGAVLCCCGSLAMYRAAVITDNLEDFVTQTFLGVEVQFGDDRRLTNYALTRGKVMFVEGSIGYTVVPERMSHYVRQQLRWNKSFFRESLWVLRFMSPRSWPWKLSLVELASWVVLTMGLLASVLIRPFFAGGVAFAYYAAHLTFSAYARSVRFLPTPSLSQHHAVATFLLAPLYAVFHVLLLVPLRVWSLITIRSGTWGTRQDGVEVAVGSPASVARPTTQALAAPLP